MVPELVSSFDLFRGGGGLVHQKNKVQAKSTSQLIQAALDLKMPILASTQLYFDVFDDHCLSQDVQLGKKATIVQNIFLLITALVWGDEHMTSSILLQYLMLKFPGTFETDVYEFTYQTKAAWHERP